MDAPGVEIRSFVEMTGSPTFNEVFLDEVRIPAENLVGRRTEGRPWPR
jgi:alkylation response protein AidB-like acyl-CoA dehydrogenase